MEPECFWCELVYQDADAEKHVFSIQILAPTICIIIVPVNLYYYISRQYVEHPFLQSFQATCLEKVTAEYIYMLSISK